MCRNVAQADWLCFGSALRRGPISAERERRRRRRDLYGPFGVLACTCNGCERRQSRRSAMHVQRGASAAGPAWGNSVRPSTGIARKGASGTVAVLSRRLSRVPNDRRQGQGRGHSAGRIRTSRRDRAGVVTRSALAGRQWMNRLSAAGSRRAAGGSVGSIDHHQSIGVRNLPRRPSTEPEERAIRRGDT